MQTTPDLLEQIIDRIAERVVERLGLNQRPTMTVAPIQPEKLSYTNRELASAIGVSQSTLWRLVQRGLLRPVPGLRHKIYSKAEVERFLSASRK